MSKRLEILKNSLAKKEAELNRRFNDHFDTVKEANGQPLNDKRNGQATLNKWEKQNDGIRNQKAEIEKTKAAIEREEYKIKYTQSEYDAMPEDIKKLIDEGILKQWRKHPRIMFVDGVEHARIIFDSKSGVISHKYVSKITDRDQFDIFKEVFNGINKAS